MNQDTMRYVRYLVILLGCPLIIVWTQAKTLSLPAEATYQLTKTTVSAAIVVAVLGFIFRSRLNIKIASIATGLLSLGLAFWVFSVVHRSADATSTFDYNDMERVVVDSVELIGHVPDEFSAMPDDEVWRAVVHSPSKQFIITCTDYVVLAQYAAREKCGVPKVGSSWPFSVDNDGRVLRLHVVGTPMHNFWKIERATLRK